MHKCTQCKFDFSINSGTLLETGWGRRSSLEQLRDGISFKQSLFDYDMLRCPSCGNVENDDRIKVFGVLRVKTFLWIVIAFILALLMFAAVEKPR